jgi:hypothetical protein
MQGIHYDRVASNTKGCDVLVIENGPLNMTFMDSDTNQPHIRKVVDIINKFEGLVIFYQSDPLLPFPFWRLTHAERPWSHPDNNVRNKRAAVEADGWADYDEIFKNKKILCVGKGLKIGWEDAMASDRFNYPFFKQNNLISFDFMATGYDRYFIPHIKDQNFDGKLFDLGYVGFPRSRVQFFKKFYGKYLDKTHTVGPWDKDAVAREVLDDFRDKGMKWYGYLKGYIEVTQFYNETKYCMNLLPRKGQELGWISNRMFESVHCGCVTFGDKDTYGIEHYVPNPLIIDFNKPHDAALEHFLSYGKQDWECLWYYQYDKIKNWDYANYVIPHFENLVSKYSSK